LNAGFKGGAAGAIGGAIIGGATGGIQFRKEIALYKTGLATLGIEGEGCVPATDAFLNNAQKAWFPDAPMGVVDEFTVEKVPEKYVWGSHQGAVTRTYSNGGVLTGRSTVWFNKDLAFINAKELFFTMGHEFVHVSQFQALGGMLAEETTRLADFRAMLDYHAYDWQNTAGGLKLNSFTTDQLKQWSVLYPQHQAMQYQSFGCTNQ
jgi:hypothetical protein